jgi:hypothetical protein
MKSFFIDCALTLRILPDRCKFGWLFLLTGLFQTATAQVSTAVLNRTAVFPLQRECVSPGTNQEFHFLHLPAADLSPIVFANSIPRGAVFCRMENLVFERCNIWLKIRAGDVDTYHSLFESPK